jgi:hypothetical protein
MKKALILLAPLAVMILCGSYILNFEDFTKEYVQKSFLYLSMCIYVYAAGLCILLCIEVNYSDPKGYGASCFTDKSNLSSPQALISTVPVVLFFTKAKRLILFAANKSLS